MRLGEPCGAGLIERSPVEPYGLAVECLVGSGIIETSPVEPCGLEGLVEGGLAKP